MAMAMSRWRAAASDAGEIEAGLFTGAVDLQRALRPDGVRALEDPVLPGGEATEDARRHVLARAEAQVRLQAGERIGRHRGAFLESDADLVVPVDVVGGAGDEAERKRGIGVERRPGDAVRAIAHRLERGG